MRSASQLFVVNHFPLKQGLRPALFGGQIVDVLRQRPTSTTTRINYEKNENEAK